MTTEKCGKREKIYKMFDEFKIEAERLRSRIKAVDKFIFIDTERENIFDFVRICNYLLTEYDFISHGKAHTTFRKSNVNKFNYDAIMKKRETVKKENAKLCAVDCQLQDSWNQIFGEYKTLTAKISSFQDFLSKHNLSDLVPYGLGKQTDVSQWLGKLPLTEYSVLFDGYDINQSISSHPWKAGDEAVQEVDVEQEVDLEQEDEAVQEVDMEQGDEAVQEVDFEQEDEDEQEDLLDEEEDEESYRRKRKRNMRSVWMNMN